MIEGPQGALPGALPHLLASSHHTAERAWTGLYNFLVAQSLLVLGWAAILAIGKPPGKALVLLAISMIGAFTALVWSLLGTRLWHYHLEYSKRLRSITHKFSIETHGGGATVWREVDAVIDRHWRDGKEFRWIKAQSGNQMILFYSPLLLGAIHVVMYGVTLFEVVDWPTQAAWPPYLLFFSGLGLFLAGLWAVWVICAPVLREPAFGAVE
jgi:hypothetical protein